MEGFEKSRDLVIVFDASGRPRQRNAAAAAYKFPSSFDAQVGKTVQHVVARQQPASFEWGETGPGGVQSWFSAEVTPGIDGALCICRDITELKRSEQRHRLSEKLMVDTQGVAHIGTWEWDISQPAATWSAELYRIYGLTPETYKPSYESYLTMVHPDDRQRVIDATNKVFHQHEPYSHDERIVRPDGSIRYLHTWAYPVFDARGALTHLIGVCQDITERAQAEEALQRLNNELEQRVSERTIQLESALRDLEAFNAMVNHDLRAPLSVIEMVIDVISYDKDNVSPKTADYLDRARRSIRDMAALMDELLEFARVGQAALQPSSVEVSALCSELLAEFQAQAPSRVTAVSIEPNMRCRVDPNLFRSVLTNLLSNAWKYSVHAEVTRIVVGSTQRADGRSLFVRDNGIGFSMDDRARLFRPFERLKNAREFSGTGVGLATVQRIVQQHGGTIDAESAPGCGATFFVMLPAGCWLP